METAETATSFFLHPGGLLAQKAGCTVTTILGSCVAVCLVDPVLKIGGINHYMLALWNGEGLPSPRYGNIAIAKLIEKMLSLGSRKENLRAKIFGGGDVIRTADNFFSIGRRNIFIAEDLLREERIPIVTGDVGGKFGRKLIFNSESGRVMVKKINKHL
ncbi:MAG: chemotaxis protein CheD [Nitrospirota bacterium]